MCCLGILENLAGYSSKATVRARLSLVCLVQLLGLLLYCSIVCYRYWTNKMMMMMMMTSAYARVMHTAPDEWNAAIVMHSVTYVLLTYLLMLTGGYTRSFTHVFT